MQNLSYALIQLLHNFGAAGILGLAGFGLWSGRAPRSTRGLLGLWLLQGGSGAAFGLVTYHFEHALPDIHGVAVAALGLKVTCVLLGLTLALRPPSRGWLLWGGSGILGATALGAAAFLRWYS